MTSNMAIIFFQMIQVRRERKKKTQTKNLGSKEKLIGNREREGKLLSEARMSYEAVNFLAINWRQKLKENKQMTNKKETGKTFRSEAG